MQSKAKQSNPSPKSYCLYKQEGSARGDVEGKKRLQNHAIGGESRTPTRSPKSEVTDARSCAHTNCRSTNATGIYVYS